MESLLVKADQMSVRVCFRPLEPPLNGYLSEALDVVVNSRLTETKQCIVLAHELGHVHHGHDRRLRHNRARDEREADVFAARLLISLERYAEAEQMYDGSPGAIARELRVTRRLLGLWGII